MWKGLNLLNKSNMWLPILASIGVGAATFYTMSKGNAPISKAMQTVAPMLSNMTNNSNDNSGTGQLGQHGMS